MDIKGNQIIDLVSNGSRANSVTAKVCLLEAYETTYKIFNHDSVDERNIHPMAIMELHPKESFLHKGRLAAITRRFADSNAGTILNMSLTEFLDNPRWFVDMMLKICDDKSSKDYNSFLNAAKFGK